jgi:hypothetical protein
MALNRARLGGDRDCVILEIGDRPQGDEVSYPTDDIQAVMDRSGKWQMRSDALCKRSLCRGILDYSSRISSIAIGGFATQTRNPMQNFPPAGRATEG